MFYERVLMRKEKVLIPYSNGHKCTERVGKEWYLKDQNLIKIGSG
jgi:hypothetical protein